MVAARLAKASCSLWLTDPATAIPARSPLTSAMKTGDAFSRKALCQYLQRHGLAGPGCPGNQAVPVAIFQQQVLRLTIAFTTAAHEYPIRHLRFPSRIAGPC